MQFLRAINWIRPSLVNLAAVVRPPHEQPEDMLAGTKPNKRSAKNGMLREEGWTTKRATGWKAAKKMLQSVETLAYCQEGLKKLIFSDLNDLHWGFFTLSRAAADFGGKIIKGRNCGGR